MAAIVKRSAPAPMMDDTDCCHVPEQAIVLKGRCSCGWPDCRQMQQEFTNRLKEGIPDSRGGNCISLDLRGDSKKDKVYRETVLSNIGCNKSNLQLERVLVARHHWSVQQLEYFKTNGVKPSTPVPACVLNKTQFSHDREDHIQGENKKVKFFHVPNVPRSEVQLQSGIGSQTSKLRLKRQLTRASARAEALIIQSNKIRQTKQEGVKEKQLAPKGKLTKKKRLTKQQLRKAVHSQAVKGKNKVIRRLQHTIQQQEITLQDLRYQLDKKEKSARDAKKKINTLQTQLRNERKKRNRSDNETTRPSKRQKYDNADVVAMIEDFISAQDGPSRLSLTDANWYATRPDAAQTLFGFVSFHELKEYVLAYFKDVKFDIPTVTVQDGRLLIHPKDLTNFEQVILVKFFMHGSPSRTKTGLCYDLHRTTITKYLKKWAPRWAKFGEHLSILPIPRDYFKRELPEEIKQLGLNDCAFMYDGKDTLVETLRKDDLLRRRTRSEKMHASAARWLNFMSVAGLTFEHTRAYGGRATEVALTEAHGNHVQYGMPLKAPLELWKNYSSQKPDRDKLSYWTALDDIAVNPFIETGIDRDEISNKEDGDGCPREFMTTDPTINLADSLHDERGKKVRAEKKLQETRSNKKTVLSREGKDSLKEQMATALLLSPQCSPEELLQQLELHETLHKMYKSGRLRKCMLSAYLFMTTDFRQDVLYYLGSPLAHTRMPADPTPPEIWLRLAKLPPEAEGLADKGFERTSRFFPFFNSIWTPRVLRGRRVKQYHESELESKRLLCTARYPNEVGFSRIVDLDILKDVVPYENFCLLPYALEWAHAHLNLGLPLRKPGSNSGLPPDYWDIA